MLKATFLFVVAWERTRLPGISDNGLEHSHDEHRSNDGLMNL
jgi:hypothetical protein